MPTTMEPEQLKRWRLILGKSANETLCEFGCQHGMCTAGSELLSGEQLEMDEALEAIYSGDSASDTSGELSRAEWEKKPTHGTHAPVKGRSFPKVARWLNQIRNFFPKDVVVLLQKDAIERRGMKELLFEPELLAQVEPSIDLVSTLLTLKNLVPEKAKEAVRDIVGKVWWWIIIGIAAGAFIHGYVPNELLASVMGNGAWWSVPAVVLIGIPMYSNAAGIIPVVEALLSKGVAIGTVLAFMMSVIALSLPEMIILRKVLTIRLIVVFVGVVAGGILAVGFLFNALFS